MIDIFGACDKYLIPIYGIAQTPNTDHKPFLYMTVKNSSSVSVVVWQHKKTTEDKLFITNMKIKRDMSRVAYRRFSDFPKSLKS